MTTARIDIIAGPTASGKSALAVARAQESNGVIINADSMQIYDALPILTARPTPADMAQAPHRLYGVLPATGSCTAQAWRALAVAEITRALDSGQRPIITGGTGFYIGSLVYGLSPIPDVPPEIRAGTVALQATLGNPGFHAVLAVLDPVMAARLHPNDTQRLIRAYEVIRATGRSLDHWQNLPREGAPQGWHFDVTLILPGRATLYDRCNRRFDQMLEMGALDEAASIDLPGNAAVSHALGYRPLKSYLAGTLDRETAVTLGKTETRQYAKRQATWFRHQLKPSATVSISALSAA